MTGSSSPYLWEGGPLESVAIAVQEASTTGRQSVAFSKESFHNDFVLVNNSTNLRKMLSLNVIV